MRMDTSGNKTSWRERIDTIREPFNPELEIQKEMQPSEDDIVMKHPENDSNIRIKDNGTIQLFAGEELGIKLDPNSNSIQHFGDKALFNTDYINFNTSDDGLRWNYTPFNRALANPWVEVLTTVPGGANILENALTSSGAFISSAPGTPAVPAGVNALMAANIDGESVLEGFEYERRARRYARGITEALRDTISF